MEAASCMKAIPFGIRLQPWAVGLLNACLACVICTVCGCVSVIAQDPLPSDTPLIIIAPEHLRAQIKRIAIWPRSEDVENADGLVSAISNYLTDNTGWFVSPPELAVEIASRAKIPTSSLDAIDPNTGDVDMKRYLQSQRSVVTTLAEETRSNAVLEVRILKVKADVRGYVAYWDGVNESVASQKSRGLAPFGGKGWVYAATADMYLWSATGKLLWRARRGFAVLGLKSGVSSKFRERPLTEVYEKTDFMQRWLEEVFSQLAPPRGKAVGPLPVPPEIQKQLEDARQAGEGQK